VTDRELRNRLVDGLLSSGAVRPGPVADALRAVPRHLFLPGVELDVAYRDDAVPTRWSADGRPTSSSSQPAIVTAMLEQLAVRPGDRILEVGSGTGWNAALLAHLAGPTGVVTTVDIDADVAQQAARSLAVAGSTRVRVVCGDGAAGWPQDAPYDRVIVTAAARDLAPAWWRQLTPGGRIVLPLALGASQQSVAFEPAGDHLDSASVLDCGFMPLQGELAGDDPVRPLGRRGLFLELHDPRRIDAAALLAALDAGAVTAVPVDLRQREALTGVRVWLALGEPAAGDLLAVREDRPWPLPVLVGDGGLAALAPVDGGRSTEVRGYGTDADRLADQLLGHVRTWIDAGRPTSARLRIAAWPAGSDVTAAPVIDRPHTRFAITWT
jgi:protein-L-isoaspartate(D-aspartate) O-methyltransferase